MASFPFHFNRFSFCVHRFLRSHNRRHRFECNIEIDRHPIRDAALNSAGTIRERANLAALRAEQIIVLAPGELNAAKAGADFESFRRGQTRADCRRGTWP